MTRFRGIRSFLVSAICWVIYLPVGRTLRGWYDRWPVMRVPTPRSLKRYLTAQDRLKK